jgi:hypothetical protein
MTSKEICWQEFRCDTKQSYSPSRTFAGRFGASEKRGTMCLGNTKWSAINVQGLGQHRQKQADAHKYGTLSAQTSGRQQAIAELLGL